LKSLPIDLMFILKEILFPVSLFYIFAYFVIAYIEINTKFRKHNIIDIDGQLKLTEMKMQILLLAF
jgi:hypothetical protein